jgi:hypothetical protein
MNMFVPSLGDVVLGVIFPRAGVPSTTTLLGIAGVGDMYVNTTAGPPATLYLCTAATPTALTWASVSVP